MWMGEDSDVSGLVFWDVALWLGKDSDVSGLVFWDVTLCGWARIATFREWSVM